ncbi:hypothetical protein BD309DRAFT_867438 [Dichomitus squalens]|nr:hypothetical protein BD309DRAFT_867438 [Dichomitus squalens]
MNGTEETLEHALWAPPVYDMSRSPRKLYATHLPQSQVDGGRDSSTVFARMAKWCPDGSVALAQCEDASFRPTEMLGICRDAVLPSSLPACLRQSAPILDYAWYPTAHSRDPACFCFVASVRECPVKLLNASDGNLRASYRIVDHRERHIAPHSVAFNIGANKLYCGFEDAIEVFDVQRPGEGIRLRTTPSKKSRDGLKGKFSRMSITLGAQTYSERCLSVGIVSALAFAPDVASDLYAAGTLSPSSPTASNIAIFSEAHGEVPLMFVGAEDLQSSGGARYGVQASVSQLMFNPGRPYLLYASFRRMDEIYCWDLRGDMSRPIEVFSTQATQLISGRTPRSLTNQRLRFDIDYAGKWLAVGDTEGTIFVFDLAPRSDTVVSANSEGGPTPSTLPVPRTLPTMRYHAHDDAIGSVTFHPLQSLLLSVSGSRHFDSDSSPDTSTASGSEEDIDDGELVARAGTPPGTRAVSRRRTKPQPTASDTTISLWSCAPEMQSET